MKTAILAIVLFCIMIFPHELGHFIAAKLVGVQVNEFAFGMGPIIWKKQRGETLHTIRLFPVGGFCAMEGEDKDEELEALEKSEDGVPVLIEHNPKAFYNKKPWEKILVLVAGSLMNMLCAFLILTLVLGIMGFTTTTIGEVYEGTPAETFGLQVGDKIQSMDILDENGETISSKEIEIWNDVSTVIQEAQGRDIAFNVKNSGEEKRTVVTPKLVEETDSEGNVTKGYSVGILCEKGHNPLTALKLGFSSTVNMTKLMFTSLRMIFSGDVGVKDMSGPVGMVKMVSDTISYGLWYYGYLVALICVNLAVINMLPLPALDGGRIIFVLWTWITKKEVPAKVEGTIHAIGLILLLALMIYVTGWDVSRLFGGK